MYSHFILWKKFKMAIIIKILMMFYINMVLTISQSMLLKKGWMAISGKPDSLLHPNLSLGFLFRKPLSTDAAFTESDLGILIVFSNITATKTK